MIITPVKLVTGFSGSVFGFGFGALADLAAGSLAATRFFGVTI